MENTKIDKLRLEEGSRAVKLEKKDRRRSREESIQGEIMRARQKGQTKLANCRTNV